MFYQLSDTSNLTKNKVKERLAVCLPELEIILPPKGTVNSVFEEK